MNKMFIKAHIEKAGEKTYRFLASTSSPDRQGDTVQQNGWELKNFMKNPVILWAHKYDELPLGKVIELSVSENGLESEIVFADEKTNPKAQQVKKLIDDGMLNAVSVGFIPKERDGNNITSAELLEISIVPVPANQEALVMASMDSGLKKEIEGILKDVEIDSSEKEEETEVIPPIEEETELTEEDTEVVEEIKEEVKAVITNKALETARDSLLNAVSEIEKLLATEVATTENTEEKSNVVVISRNVVEDLKYNLRHENKSNDKILSLLKKL